MPVHEGSVEKLHRTETEMKNSEEQSLSAMKREILIRRMETEDADAVARIEADLFSDAWSEAGLAGVTKSSCDIGYVCVGASGILAYCLVRHVLDEGEILRVGVSRSYQRRGLAEKLLGEVMTELSQVQFWNLEVRESNFPAIQLYKKLGFMPIGTRRNYYHEPTENAVLMQCHEGELLHV